MTRRFRADPVAPEVVDRVLDAGRRAPAAGNTVEGRAFLLPEPEAYWATTLAGRGGFELLRAAPVLVVVCCRPDAYAERYAEPDKRRAGTLGRSPAAWPQPFWWIDAGLAGEAMLLQARAEGLGACLFGLFEHEAAVLDRFGVPPGWRGAFTIALGHPLEPGAAPGGRSATRRRAPLDEVVHRGRW